MRIVIYGFSGNGFGDLLFVIKTFEALKRSAQFHDARIELVMPSEDKQKVIEKLNIQFKIYSIEEFQGLQDESKINCYIEGPIPTKIDENGLVMAEKLRIPNVTPVLLLVEYSCVEMAGFVLPYERLMQALRRKGYRTVQKVGTGLGSSETGIWLDQEILKAANSKNQDEIKNAYWDKLPEIKALLLNRQIASHYHARTQLTLLYHAKLATLDDFLSCYEALIVKHKKNQDLVCIGHKPELFEEQLKKNVSLQKLLSKNHFSIQLIRLDQQKPGFSFQEVKTEKTIRILYGASVPHSQMKALMILSDWVSVTGDQSFGEAISALKAFIFYETLMHKCPLAENFFNLVNKYSTSNDVSTVAEFLYYHPRELADGASKDNSFTIMREGRLGKNQLVMDSKTAHILMASEEFQQQFKMTLQKICAQPQISLNINLPRIIRQFIDYKYMLPPSQQFISKKRKAPVPIFFNKPGSQPADFLKLPLPESKGLAKKQRQDSPKPTKEKAQALLGFAFFPEAPPASTRAPSPATMPTPSKVNADPLKVT